MNTKLIIKEERPAYRLGNAGARALATEELLTLLCGFPDKDQATQLLSQTHGLRNLARMTPMELQEFEGIGPVIAARLLAAFELGRRVMVKTSRLKIDGVTSAKNFLISHFSGLAQEQFVTVSLDTKNHIIRTDTIYTGSANQLIFRPAEIFAHAVRCHALAVIVAHNHPSGDPTPSPEDIKATRVIVQAGNLLGIEVLDHIVVGDECFSIKERHADCW